jgi:hypothetical protein
MAAAPTPDPTAAPAAETAETATPVGRWGRRGRSLAAIVLVVVFTLSFLASGVGLWVQRSTLDRDVWAERVVPLGTEPEVQAALAAWTTDELMSAIQPQELIAEALPDRARPLAIPLSGAVRTYVGEKVDEFFASERFERIWVAASTKAHEAAVDTLRGDRPAVVADDEKVEIDLLPLIDAVLAQILEEAPGLVGSSIELPTISVDDVPTESRQRLADALGIELDDDFGTITVYDGGKLSLAQTAVRWLDRLPLLTGAIAVLSAAGALWLSPRRRRTAFHLLAGAAIACVLVRRVVFLLQSEVSGLVVVDVNRQAADVIVAALVDPLTAAASTVLWVLALVAAALAVSGPSTWATALRTSIRGGAVAAGSSAADRARAPETAAWVAQHVDALRIAGWVAAAAIVWFASLTWLLLFVVTCAVAAWQLLLVRFVAAADAADAAGVASATAGGTAEISR